MKKTKTDSTENPAPSDSTPSSGQNSRMECAEKASSTMNLEPVYTTADYSWNADTVASSHMTLHWHWVQNYWTECVPMKLVDNNIIYSEGVGLVFFKPWINGKVGDTEELLWVLHVPKLQNNLLSVI